MTLLALTEAGDAGTFATSVPGSVVSLAWLVPVLPLAGFVFLVLFGGRLEDERGETGPAGGRFAGWLATTLVACGFLISLAVLAELLRQPADARRIVVEMFTWLEVGDLRLTTDLLVDPLSVTMMLVITGVGAVIHLYSIGYMEGDEREARYFAYLNLFVFSMLVLVLAANLVILFVGWELVGLCSYLLIGFWFEERSNAVAAKKAFVVNRVGDVSFSIGLFLVFATFGSLAFADVLPAAAETLQGNSLVATAIGLLLLGGAVGKSAQIPLHVWLPDAMAGPTPVSALIHAATMVTAGVYMIARASAIYVTSAVALQVVALVGVATALLAALIAIQQDDIKKVLAYSTVSQLGYMFVGVGVGAFGAGIFHLVTHAFFKALLFLAAGSVMHALANRTDMWQMGGLRRIMPITFGTSVVAVLAISGVFPFAGFFSKEQILTAAYESGHTLVWLVGLVTAGLTAFYMTRWLLVPFFGPRRWQEDTAVGGGDPRSQPDAHAASAAGEGTRPTEDAEPELHPHESPWSMTVPLVALAVASVLGGFLNPAHHGPLDRWLEPSVAQVEAQGGGALPEAALIALSLAAAAAGIGLAWMVYRDAGRRDPLPARLGALATAMRRTFWVDDAYERVFVEGGGLASRALVWFDERVVDGAVDGVGTLTSRTASRLRGVQTGLVRGYLAALVLGTVVLVGVFFLGAG